MSPRKRGLGRGLDALLQPAVGLQELPISQLRPNRLQPRQEFDDESLEELAESIRVQGVVQPIVVTPAAGGGYTIVVGERRWRAAQRAGLLTVPAVVREVAGEREMLELALVENLQRSDLNPIEEALAYEALRQEFNLSQDEIAERVGKARSTVANALRLLRLPAAVQEQLRVGRLSAGQARPLVGVDSAKQQEELARRAVREGLSARQLERLVAGGKPPRVTRPTRSDVHDQAAAEALTRKLQAPVEIHRRGSGGHVRIRFHSEEELIRLYELLIGRSGGT